LPTLALPTAAPAPLPGAARIEGLYMTAPVAVDGIPLFRIATPANVGADQMNVEQRQQSIAAAIAQLLAPDGTGKDAGTIYDPATLHVEIQTSDDQTLLAATDQHHTTPLPILTVTDVDAKYQRLPVPALADQWREKLQTALAAALLKRQPAVVRQNLEELGRVAIALALASLAAFGILYLLRKQAVKLHASIDANTAELRAAAVGAEEPEANQQRRRFMGFAIRAAGPEMSLRVLRGFSSLVWLAIALAWAFAIVWALALFPQTTEAAHFLSLRLQWLAFVVVAAFVAIRGADILVSRLAVVYAENARLTLGDERARLLLRIPTIASAISAAVTVLVVFVAVIAGMYALDVSTASVLTFGGIAALGVTFAAQSLLRDFLNGVFVLIEDQYVVGDYVIVDEWSGVVEHMTLRVVQIRDASGNLITIPHGQVTQVVNCSRNWSRVDYRVPIDPHADVDKAIGILRSTVEAFAGDESYHGWFLDPVELIGVDAVSSSGIVLRVSIKTAPLRQFELKRQINLRVVEEFRAAGIAFGIDPKATVSMSLNPGPA
jgi:small conductance mechanosensitive channel